MGALLNGGATAIFVALAAHRVKPHQRILTRANLLTLSRVAGAAMLAGTAAAPRLGRRIAWFALLWSGPSDWLDGPFARHDGPTALGELLDIEADSWVTLWAALAGYRTRRLPPASLLPPLLRYAIPAFQAYRKRSRPRDRIWQRVAAGLQASALLLALAPSSRLQRMAGAAAPYGALGQTAAMALTIVDLLRATAPYPSRGRAGEGAD